MNPNVIVCPIACADADGDLLTQAASLARWYDATLHVVRATGTGGRDRAAIVDQARRRSADLLVVGLAAADAAGYSASGAFAAAIARSTERPTLALPPGHVLRRGGEDAPPFRNIVSAVDFSQASVRAADQALALAQQSGGRLTLLHVLDGFPFDGARASWRVLAQVGHYSMQIDRLNRELARLASSEALHWCDVETQTAPGAVHDTVASVAAAQRADLIVLGAAARPRLVRLVSGSTVTRVLRRASRPVLIVPGPAGLAAVFADRCLAVDAVRPRYVRAAATPSPGAAGRSQARMDGRSSWR